MAASQLAIPVPLRHDETGLHVTRLDRAAWSRLVFTLEGRSVAARWSVGAASAEVLLETREPVPDGAQSIRLFIRHDPCFLATVHTDSRRPVHWTMRGRPRGRADFFSYAARWSAKVLGGGRNRFRAFTHALERELLERLREPAVAVLGRLDRRVLAAARRFPPELRVRAYGALSRDERGWARQTLSAGVGHFLFAFALLDVDETVAAGVKLLRDLAEGRRLNDALDDAIAAWAAALPTWGRNIGNWTDDQVRAFHVAATKAGAERQRMLASQRLLVRRAGARVDPVLLLLPPPLRFAPEDVPATPGANAAWFRVMKVPRLTLEAVEMRHPAPFLEAFAAFASRHAPAIARPPRGLSLEPWLDGLCEALLAAERTPSRRTDPVALREAVDVGALRARPAERRLLYPWVEAPPPPPPPAPPLPAPAPPAAAPRRRARARPAPPPVPPLPEPARPPDRIVAVTGVRPEHVISWPHFEPWTAGGVEVRQLTTLRQLRAEGARMRNCVASYREIVEAGDMAILHATVHGEPLTIGVDLARRRRWVSELKGFANRPARREEWVALRPFFEANGIAFGGEW